MKIISFLKNKENWYILISVFLTIIILIGIVNYLPKSCNIKKQSNLIINNTDLLPQPDDNSIITSASKTPEIPTTTTPNIEVESKPITENTTQSQKTLDYSEPAFNSTPIPEFYISTLAPINESFITGNNIILAFSTSTGSYGVVTEISSVLPDNTIIKQTYPINIPAKTLFSQNHTLKISFDANAKEINAHLYLIDINNKIINQKLIWYK